MTNRPGFTATAQHSFTHQSGSCIGRAERSKRCPGGAESRFFAITRTRENPVSLDAPFSGGRLFVPQVSRHHIVFGVHATRSIPTTIPFRSRTRQRRSTFCFCPRRRTTLSIPRLTPLAFLASSHQTSELATYHRPAPATCCAVPEQASRAALRIGEQPARSKLPRGPLLRRARGHERC